MSDWSRRIGQTALTELVDGDILICKQGGVQKDFEIGLLVSFLAPLFFPIGMVYTQYPGKDSPATLGFPGTWENISSEFAGDFFRAEGGEASAYGSGEQLDAFQGFKTDINYTGKTNAAGFINDTGLDFANINGGSNLAIQPEGVPVADSNGTPRMADETRPINHTIRIWERTS